MTAEAKWLTALEKLSGHLNDLRELEEARRMQNPTMRTANLKAYLEAKQTLLERLCALAQNGGLSAVEERLAGLEPRETAAHFCAVWERVKSLLAQVLVLHDQNLGTLRQESEDLLSAWEELGHSLAYLRTYPLNRQQSVRVNIIG